MDPDRGRTRPPISGATGSGAVTDAPVNAGTYTLASRRPGRLHRRGLVLHRRHPHRHRASSCRPAAAPPAPSTTTTSRLTLTLVKTVDNGQRGTAVPADWTLTATGPTPITGPGSSPAVTEQTVNAGTYALSESGGPAGYTASAWSCTGGTVDRIDGRRAQRRQRHLHDHQQRQSSRS